MIQGSGKRSTTPSRKTSHAHKGMTSCCNFSSGRFSNRIAAPPFTGQRGKQSLHRKNQAFEGEGRRPLIFQHIQADYARIRVDVRMKLSGDEFDRQTEFHVWRVVGIVPKVRKVKEEDTVGIGSARD